MTPATTVAGRQKVWTRDHLIQSLRDYAQLYGDDFTTAAFNPSVAKWRDDPVSRERYLLGNTLRGEPWPALNTIRKSFGGFNAAREAAGLEPNKPGPSKRGRRPDHKHAPIRDVSDRVRVLVRERVVSNDLPTNLSTNAPKRAELSAARRAEASATRRAAKREEQLEKVNARLHDVRERAREAATEARRQRVRATSAAQTAAALREELSDVNAALAVVSEKADRMTAEALSLRSQMREVTEELFHAREELSDVQELRELADPAELEAARAEVRDARAWVAEARAAVDRADARALAAEAEARRAEAERRSQQRKAQSEAEQRRAIQLAVAGHDRKLTRAELGELRASGPAGSAVFAQAIRDVALAQARGQREPLKRALRRAAAAAIRWMERL
jgi:hypothetical protein